MKNGFLIFLLLLVSTISFAQTNSMSQYIFGHSLINHAIPTTSIPSNETSVPHWMAVLADEAGKTYKASGQYGFLQQHRNLPPSAQWGFDTVTPAWDDAFPFSSANFDNVLVTAGNFHQWQAPNLNYWSDTVSPLSCTREILDWVKTEEPSCRFYIYENWPDMANYIASGTFPPTQSEWVNYNNYLNGGFHNWWIEYQDSMLVQRPNDSVRMIPVGPIISKLVMSAPLNLISVTDLYEDDAPHGKPTIYFLAGLVTYMATYQEKAPATYAVPNTVDSIVFANYNSIVDTIWSELLKFNVGTTNVSRVFFDVPSTTSIAEEKPFKKGYLYPNPSQGITKFSGLNYQVVKVRDVAGREIDIEVINENQLDFTHQKNGIYLVLIKDKTSGLTSTFRFVKN